MPLSPPPAVARPLDRLRTACGTALPAWPAWCYVPLAGIVGALAAAAHAAGIAHSACGQRALATGRRRFSTGTGDNAGHDVPS